ncbi:transposase [Candidatus Zixiibacteriota bacterium]
MNEELSTRGRQPRRRFTSQQKLEILREWERTGNGAAVARQHGLPAAQLYRWKKSAAAESTGRMSICVAGVRRRTSSPGSWNGKINSSRRRWRRRRTS